MAWRLDSGGMSRLCLGDCGTVAIERSMRGHVAGLFFGLHRRAQTDLELTELRCFPYNMDTMSMWRACCCCCCSSRACPGELSAEARIEDCL